MAAKKPINPAALSPAELAAALSKLGTEYSEAQIKKDLADSAPANADGTIHLVHFTAWLAGHLK